MAWIILFIISYIIFFLLVDLKSLKRHLWCGFMAISMQLFIDTIAIRQNFYIVHEPGIAVLGSSMFFMFGPVLVVGTLLAQFHPQKRGLVISQVFVLTALYSLQEFLLLNVNALSYVNWSFTMSVGVNLMVMSTLSWFCLVILNKRMGQR